MFAEVFVEIDGNNLIPEADALYPRHEFYFKDMAMVGFYTKTTIQNIHLTTLE